MASPGFATWVFSDARHEARCASSRKRNERVDESVSMGRGSVGSHVELYDLMEMI
jgi:hypothetical protein